jgi:tRNA threonylcarbamoyladenosine biosynthesis protein TsaE
MEYSLVDSRATEDLGRSLAQSLPGAATPGAAAPDAVAPDAVAPDAVAPGKAATRLVTGAVLYLCGELGAGKTTCVRSLLRDLGVTGLVRSPTYTLVETYVLPALTCVHVDLYRLQALTEVDELGLRDMVGPGCLLLVEWPEKGEGALPPADAELTLLYAGDARRARLQGHTPFGINWLQNLASDTSLAPYVSNLT